MSSGNITDRGKLRRFGLTVAIGFTTLASISWWRGHTVAPTVLWSLAAVLLVPTLVAPAALGPVERAWMTLGGWLAWINTRIILTVLFYVVVTPVGLVVRMFRDPLDRQLSETGKSYWIRRTVQPFKAEDYQRQF